MSDELSIPSPTYRIPRQRRGLDPLTRKLAMIACGVGGALVVGIGGWTMLGHRSTSVPVVQAENGPIRVKPANPGGMQVSGASEDIMSGGAATDAGKLAPAPEAPNPQGLRAQTPPKPAAAPLAATSLPAPAAMPRAVAEKPLATPDKRAVVASAPERPAPASAAAGGGALVQFAAVGSEQAARDEWQRLAHRLPDLLRERHAAISKTEHDGRTLWRVRTGGFSDVSQATAFCERIRAKGAGCSVATF